MRSPVEGCGKAERMLLIFSKQNRCCYASASATESANRQIVRTEHTETIQPRRCSDPLAEVWFHYNLISSWGVLTTTNWNLAQWWGCCKTLSCMRIVLFVVYKIFQIKFTNSKLLLLLWYVIDILRLVESFVCEERYDCSWPFLHVVYWCVCATMQSGLFQWKGELLWRSGPICMMSK